MVPADTVRLSTLRRCDQVVCAGVKSILDIPRTLEYLESQGVAVMGYGAPCGSFPLVRGALQAAAQPRHGCHQLTSPRKIASALKHWAGV